MKTQHTPGKWTLQQLETARNDYEGWKTFAIRSPQNVCLAVVGEVDHYHEADHEANARLIAASPMLLEALKALTALAALNTPNGATKEESVYVDKWERDLIQTYDLVFAARAAISAAEGTN